MKILNDSNFFESETSNNSIKSKSHYSKTLPLNTNLHSNSSKLALQDPSKLIKRPKKSNWTPSKAPVTPSHIKFTVPKLLSQSRSRNLNSKVHNNTQWVSLTPSMHPLHVTPPSTVFNKGDQPNASATEAGIVHPHQVRPMLNGRVQ